MGFVNYEVDGMVGLITINRPEALNALNSQVLTDLEAVFDGVDQKAVRCLILTGAGEKSFVAGAVIAAINGYALGGGNELAMSCDIRICSDNAVFGQPETGLGVTPGFGGTQRLSRLINPGMAKQILYTSRNIKADEAYRLGLVNAVYAQEELMPAAKKMAAQIAANGPIAVRACKKLVNDGLQVDIDQAIVLEEKAFGSMFATNDQKEGMGAFVEKRKEKHFTNT